MRKPIVTVLISISLAFLMIGLLLTGILYFLIGAASFISAYVVNLFIHCMYYIAGSNKNE